MSTETVIEWNYDMDAAPEMQQMLVAMRSRTHGGLSVQQCFPRCFLTTVEGGYEAYAWAIPTPPPLQAPPPLQDGAPQ